ncbi:MAG: electron transport complex subunit E [Kiritimatiellae bacterium]|nr:electron transport complex subunit E [Kiritimatiellia bacterium]
MKVGKELVKGLWSENPIFRLVLGMCPTLAVSTSVKNGLGMGLAATFVLVCSNAVISLMRKAIPAKVRIPCFIVVIATFVTIVDLVMKATVYDLHKELGLFIPLIVVNCIILGRAEAFASKNGFVLSIADGVGMGAGFTLALAVLGSIREVLGNGTFLDMPIGGIQPMILMILPPGAFIALGCLLGLMNHVAARRARKSGRAYAPPAQLDCRHCVICKWGAEE